jgi:Tfp pilus assembly protein PilF
VPDNAETNFALGNLRLAQGRADEAQAFYLRTLQLDARHKGALTNLGVLSLDAGQVANARGYFTAATKLAPRDAKAHFLLAKSAFAVRDFAAATAEIDRAIAIESAQPEFLALRDDIRKAAAANGN